MMMKHRLSSHQKGFTLIELVTTVIVMMLLLSVAMPSFSRTFESYKMRRLADEIHQLFVSAKSEAIMRREGIWIHFSSNNASVVQKDWTLSVQNSSSNVNYLNAKNTALHLIQGKDHDAVYLLSTANIQLMPFDPATGKLIGVARSITFYIHPNQALKVNLHNITGRVKICGVDLTNEGGSDFYGYSKC